jgi:hypothetical protein
LYPYCTLSMLGLAGSTRSNSKWRVNSVGNLALASLGDRERDLTQTTQSAYFEFTQFCSRLFLLYF